MWFGKNGVKVFGREKIYKKCPRCGEKTFVKAAVCDNCKLVFSRLQYASNKKAKKCIKAGKKNEVIKTSELPKDLNKWKLFAIAMLGGVVGAHNIYIGRYIKGFFSLFFVVLTFVLVMVLNGDALSLAFNRGLFIPGGLVVLFWWYDALMIGLGKYKVPIALDMEGEYGQK